MMKAWAAKLPVLIPNPLLLWLQTTRRPHKRAVVAVIVQLEFSSLKQRTRDWLKNVWHSNEQPSTTMRTVQNSKENWKGLNSLQTIWTRKNSSISQVCALNFLLTDLRLVKNTSVRVKVLHSTWVCFENKIYKLHQSIMIGMGGRVKGGGVLSTYLVNIKTKIYSQQKEYFFIYFRSELASSIRVIKQVTCWRKRY